MKLLSSQTKKGIIAGIMILFIAIVVGWIYRVVINPSFNYQIADTIYEKVVKLDECGPNKLCGFDRNGIKNIEILYNENQIVQITRWYSHRNSKEIEKESHVQFYPNQQIKERKDIYKQGWVKCSYAEDGDLVSESSSDKDFKCERENRKNNYELNMIKDFLNSKK